MMTLHRLLSVHLGAAVLDEGPRVVMAVVGSDGVVVYRHLSPVEAGRMALDLVRSATEAEEAAAEGHPSAGPAGPEDAVHLLRLAAHDLQSGVSA
jgi:hypothetical protein